MQKQQYSDLLSITHGTKYFNEKSGAAQFHVNLYLPQNNNIETAWIVFILMAKEKQGGKQSE